MSYSLFLFSDEPIESSVTQVGLIQYLSGLEFLVANTSSTTLLPGSNLMDFITFLGCSPSLKLGELESTIRIHLFDEKKGLGGDSIETIRYPKCKHVVDDPVKLINSYPESTTWTCSHCENSGKTEDINWRKSAGFSTVFIEISSIFPKEAIPSDKLISALSGYTGSHWSWFYSTSSL